MDMNSDNSDNSMNYADMARCWGDMFVWTNTGADARADASVKPPPTCTRGALRDAVAASWAVAIADLVAVDQMMLRDCNIACASPCKKNSNSDDEQ